MSTNDPTIRAGMTVRTAATLEPWNGPGEGGPNVRQRRPNAVGVVHRDVLMWPDGCWYVQHEGDAVLTIYRERELTPEVVGTPSDGTPKAAPADKAQAFLAALDAVEAKRDVLAAEIRALGDMLPEGCDYARTNIEDAVKNAERVTLDQVRYVVTEAARPKGPMVTICVPFRRTDHVDTYTSELAEVTSGALVMCGGTKFSRKTGQKIGHTDRWSPTPYITREEIDRVLALKWKPAKETKR